VVNTKSERDTEKETGRLEAFSDGVFAVAITILVFDLLKVPQAAPGQVFSPGDLANALGTQWPAYLTFALSFVTILIMWMNHHSMFRMVHKVSAPFMLANGLLLLLVTAVPFPTALLGDYLTEPAASTAAVVYSGVFVLISVAYNLVWWAARQGHLLRPDTTAEQVQQRARLNFIGIPAYLLALLCAFAFPVLSVGICGALWCFWVFASFKA